MAVAFADKPNHFVNFPLAQFKGFLDKFKQLQSQLLGVGVDCKLQEAPHVSITMLDVTSDKYKHVDISIQEIIDDMDWDVGLNLVFHNPHILGRCLVLDVRGLDELHDEIVEYIREKGCVADQSRQWIAHCTIAQLSNIIPKLDLQFNYNLKIEQTSPARLELVKLGAVKHDGFYEPIFSHWMGVRTCYTPPTQKLGSIMGICCLSLIREQLSEGDLPEDDEQAFNKLAYHYQYNLWFFRYVYDNSSIFRRVCKVKDAVDCVCTGFHSDSSDSGDEI